MTLLFPLYRFLARSLAPMFLKKHLQQRALSGKEEKNRLGERYGHASKIRPKGKLIWIHGASLGETTASLSLINRFLDAYPETFILVTSGTIGSAKMLEKRLPERAFHQYVPLDVPRWCQRFIDTWNPDLILWIESEIWPNLLQSAKNHKAPFCLVNAHLSEKSRRFWSYIPKTAKRILSCFDTVMTQTTETELFLKKHGVKSTLTTGNLKFSAQPLPDDPPKREVLKHQIGGRPFWLAASTHPGEEDLIAQAHLLLKKKFPSLLTLLVPRHPERGEALQTMLSSSYPLRIDRRSVETVPSRETDLYLMDTFGELGIAYRLADIVFLGGSLVNIGGHNLIEPALLNCAILHGPYMSAQQKMQDLFSQNQSIEQVKNLHNLVRSLDKLLSSRDLVMTRSKRAMDVTQNQAQVLEQVWQHLAPFRKRLES